jgi:hypothetical protein
MAQYRLTVHTVDGKGREPMTEAEMQNDTRTEGSAVLKARRRAHSRVPQNVRRPAPRAHHRCVEGHPA